MNIVFFGTSSFAVPALSLLVKAGMGLKTVITAPNAPKGRGLLFSPPPVLIFMRDQKIYDSITILQPETMNGAFIKAIQNIQPDLGIVAAYGKILPRSLISSFSKGILNIHPSLLPKYRGPSPIQASILNGDKETGITIMMVDEKMDHGPVLAQKKVTISNNTTYSILHDTLANLGAELIVETIPAWSAGNIRPVAQNENGATYTKRIKKADGKIDWKKSVNEIERMIRAFNPWPGAFTTTISANGTTKMLKIKSASVVAESIYGIGSAAKTGDVHIQEDGYPTVWCKDGFLKLLVIQPEGKNEMPGSAFVRGQKGKLVFT